MGCVCFMCVRGGGCDRGWRNGSGDLDKNLYMCFIFIIILGLML